MKLNYTATLCSAISKADTGEILLAASICFIDPFFKRLKSINVCSERIAD